MGWERSSSSSFLSLIARTLYHMVYDTELGYLSVVFFISGNKKEEILLNINNALKNSWV